MVVKVTLEDISEAVTIRYPIPEVEKYSDRVQTVLLFRCNDCGLAVDSFQYMKSHLDQGVHIEVQGSNSKLKKYVACTERITGELKGSIDVQTDEGLITISGNDISAETEIVIGNVDEEILVQKEEGCDISFNYEDEMEYFDQGCASGGDSGDDDDMGQQGEDDDGGGGTLDITAQSSDASPDEVTVLILDQEVSAKKSSEDSNKETLSCSICQRKFTRMDSLKVHESFHQKKMLKGTEPSTRSPESKLAIQNQKPASLGTDQIVLTQPVQERVKTILANKYGEAVSRNSKILGMSTTPPINTNQQDKSGALKISVSDVVYKTLRNQATIVKKKGKRKAKIVLDVDSLPLAHILKSTVVDVFTYTELPKHRLKFTRKTCLDLYEINKKLRQCKGVDGTPYLKGNHTDEISNKGSPDEVVECTSFCEYCYITIATGDELELHSRCHNNIGDGFHCVECIVNLQEFATWYDVRKHYEFMHPDKVLWPNTLMWNIGHGHRINPKKPITCLVCCKPSYLHNMDDLKLHLRFHRHYDYRLICDCGKEATYGTSNTRCSGWKHMMYHVVTRHKEIDVYWLTEEKCDHCDEIFGSKMELRQHTLSKHRTKTHCCTVCYKRYKDPADLATHMSSTHSQQEEFMCDACGRKYPSKRSLQKHSLVHRKDAFKCDKCTFRCLTKHSLIFHVKKRHPDVSECFMCERCGRVLKSKRGLTVHNLQYHTENRVQCKICKVFIKNKIYLRKHYAAKHKTKVSEETISKQQEMLNIQCEECPLRFEDEPSRAQHVLDIHTTGNKYPCDICDKKFKTVRLCKEHKKVHEDTEYKCDRCNAILKYKKSLLNHKKKCDLKDPDDIPMRHPRGGKPKIFPCSVCEKKFTTRRSARYHESVHAGLMPFSCNMCSFTCGYKITLWNHKKKEHNIPKDDNVNIVEDVSQQTIILPSLPTTYTLSNGNFETLQMAIESISNNVPTEGQTFIISNTTPFESIITTTCN